MRFQRFAATIGVVGACLLLANPVLAQGRGGGNGGGGNGGGQSCPDAAFPATLVFQAVDGLGPAITSSDGGPLSANVNYGGNVASRTETESPTMFPLPISLSFPAGSGYPGPGQGSQIVAIDPHVSTWVFLENSDDLQALPCQMFDMSVDDGSGSARYRMRLTLQWREKDGVPVDWDTQKWDQRWVVRYRPHKPEFPVTWVDAVRTANDTWELTSRNDSSPAHFAHLEKSGTGKGKNQIPAVHTTPVMPIKLLITLNCDLGAGEACAETGGGS